MNDKTRNIEELNFIHIADLHLGGFREEILNRMNFKNFQRVINDSIEKKIDFLIISGDIFNTPIPNIDIVNRFILEIKKLNKLNIPVFCIGGSHDYSNLKKSYIELLNNTGIICDVNKLIQIPNSNNYELEITKNEKLKLNICGLVGKKTGLDKNLYMRLNKTKLKENLDENYLNIFLFHTTIDDLLPAKFKLRANFKSDFKLNLLPEGFNYYAGGHIHTNQIKEFVTEDKNKKKVNSIVTYSGCLFPNNFSELIHEDSTYNLCNYNFNTKKIQAKKIIINNYEKEYLKIESQNHSAIEFRNKIIEELNKINSKQKILLLELCGIVDGKIIDIGINKIIDNLYNDDKKSPIHILKNTYKLKSNITDSLLDYSKTNIDNLENLENKIIDDMNLEIFFDKLIKENKDIKIDDKTLYDFLDITDEDLIINKTFHFDFIENKCLNVEEYNSKKEKIIDKIKEIFVDENKIIKEIFAQDFSKIDEEKKKDYESRIIKTFDLEIKNNRE